MFPRFVAIEVLSMAHGFLLAGVELAAAHVNYDENPAAQQRRPAAAETTAGPSRSTPCNGMTRRKVGT